MRAGARDRAVSDGTLISPVIDEAQLAEIRRLAHEIWREHYPGIISAEQVEYMLERQYSPAALRRSFREEGVRFDRALRGGEAVGFSAYGPLADPDALKLHSLYVQAAARRSGCGSAMLARVVTHAREGGCARVVLRVNRGNQTAIRAYRRWGFRIRGPLVTDIGNGFVMDDHRMELAVASRSARRPGAPKIPG